MTFPNPFVIGSGPPGTNYKTIAKAYDAGWGGVVAKTIVALRGRDWRSFL